MPVYDGGFGGRVIVRESFDTPERPDIGFDESGDASSATQSTPVVDRNELLQRVGEIVTTDDAETDTKSNPTTYNQT